jgi:hypothetical protein
LCFTPPRLFAVRGQISTRHGSFVFISLDRLA